MPRHHIQNILCVLATNDIHCGCEVICSRQNNSISMNIYTSEQIVAEISTVNTLRILQFQVTVLPFERDTSLPITSLYSSKQ